MIHLKGRGAVYGEVWYKEEPSHDAPIDIVQYRQREAPISGARSIAYLSMVTDLSLDEDAIIDQFRKECRYKIKRAEGKDRLDTEFILDPRKRLDEFRRFFDVFASEKSIDLSDDQWLAAACEAGQLVLTSASKDGEPLVWHAYVLIGKFVSIQYSGSYFRDKDNEYRALIGRANRWLHWRDILRFKEMGVARYDWGGLFEDTCTPERAGINYFKSDFRGQQVRVYDCTVPVTLRGRLYLPLRDAWRLRKRTRRSMLVRPGFL